MNSNNSPEQPIPQHGRLPYFPGLDGLRALAVIAVLLYHANLPVLGGFLGVESFFVLSGFLITGLLLAEWRQEGRIDLQVFWLRRARRLLPALFFMLAGTLVYASLKLRSELPDLRGDLLAALAYVMNWRLIFGGQSYFDPMVRPSLLQHLWSLAIEEQFYLVWPLIFVAGMRWLRAGRLLVMILVAALASTGLILWLYRPGADPSRIYYGTDTRAAGLLLGAALAMLWTRLNPPDQVDRRVGLLLDGAGSVALVGLIASFFWLSEQHSLLYPGGFALVAIMTAIVIATLTYPGARLVPRVLGSRPLVWIGLRSYGLYLWHWPVFLVTRPYVDVPLDGLPLLALRLAIVGVLVELSYRYIEMPARQGALQWTWHRVSAFWTSQHPMRDDRLQRGAYVIRWVWLLIPVLIVLAFGFDSSGRNVQRIVAPVTSAKTSENQNTQPATIPALPAASPTTKAPELAPILTATPTFLTPVITEVPTAAPVVRATEVPPTPTPADPVPLDPTLVAQLQQMLDEQVASGFVPGAVMSVSIPGHVPWSGSSGVADRRQDLPMKPDTLIRVASVTKMFTAVVVLQLAEEGKIDLDAPIGTWLPDIVALDNRTTVRHLLNHTSGIFDYLEDRRFFVEAYRNPKRTYTPAELVGMVDQFAAAFEPGTEHAWKYSSTNYVILGMLVEQVTGRTLAQEMRQRIFDPLGLLHTYFAPDEPVEGTVALGYIDDSDRANVSMTFVYATGNIISTAGDLQRFIDGLFDDRLLKPESRAMMEALVETGGAYDMPELEYGLGLMRARLNVGPSPDGDPRPAEISTVLGHIGGVAGFRTAAWHVPESDITITISLNQADIDPNLLARDVLDQILTWQGR